jgi:hypothetical protein
MFQNTTLTDVGVLSQGAILFLRVGALHYIIAPLPFQGAVFFIAGIDIIYFRSTISLNTILSIKVANGRLKWFQIKKR